MFVLIFVNFNPRVLSRKLRARAQASHGNITVLSLLNSDIWMDVYMYVTAFASIPNNRN